MGTNHKKIVSKGAKAVHSPADMPWNKRTALFADPDGNIHELFAELETPDLIENVDI
ncbi:MAG: hypothetical protein PF518_17380 [Spirochaetaceae bacterium]|nr:hypothetical protein [Spirochaetaceae bacterium]